LRSHRLLAAVLGLLCVLPASAPTLRGEEQDTAFDGFERAPDPAEVGGPDAELYREGVRLQQAGRYRSARKRFFRLIEEYPDSPYVAEAEDRSGPNAFLGFTCMHDPRPSERRIDVALMGDGYPLDRQDRFDKDAAGHLKVLLKEPTFAAYESYFNFWRFNLASQDTGVDEVEPVLPDDELEEHLKRRRKKRKVRTYETALDCKAAGPQGQVAANPRCVWHYLSYLDVNDALAVCFAKMGSLGMGGMGIATTGPKGVVVHEFGHAFGGLLDEYANNPGPPTGFTESVNTTTNRQNPPWKHFLEVGYPGVGVFEGAATFQTGVWRPAHGCAMNTGGNEYCPVCREATLLMIYTYVSPIDVVRPTEREIHRGEDGWPAIELEPMRPATHELEVTWYLGDEPPVTQTDEPERTAEDDFAEGMLTEEEKKLWERIKRRRKAEGRTTPRTSVPYKPGSVRRARGTGRDGPPVGERIKGTKRRARGGVRVHGPVLPDLGPGRHLLTAVVRDPAKPRGARHPWVLKDDRGLLEDRHTFVLVVPGAPSDDGP
jgi:hypothetical protein